MSEQLHASQDDATQGTSEIDSANNNIEGNLMPPPSQIHARRTANRRITFNENVETVAAIDARLNEFLSRINVSSTAKNIILNADFTYEDFVYEMDKEDLRRLGLK